MMDIIDRLHQDHTNFAKVLAVLSEQTGVLEQGETPDYALVLDCLDYMNDYSNTVHHAGEDALFGPLGTRDDELGDTVRELQREHAELRRITTDLRELLKGIGTGAIMDKAELASMLSDYLVFQKRHIEVEEDSVLPSIRAAAASGDIALREVALPDSIDPLFGQEVRDQYLALLNRIESEARLHEVAQRR